MIPIVVQHLQTLEEKINFYFPSLDIEKYDWVRNPFIKFSSNIGLTLCEEEKLASLSSDRGLKIKHTELPIDTFWISIRNEYPSVSKIALSILIQFSTSYLCEYGFSALNNIKSKKRETSLCGGRNEGLFIRNTSKYREHCSTAPSPLFSLTILCIRKE